ncbi:MAG: sigma-70 family RNA polymerase sigma factor [Planctomycetes bacterium]|nr:sigma-70 family RNA polymerase sigma factor [Planctomycetota bacterium]MCB9891522.1 sigma-70 family RNA polymerase sigma factor [Planctomycetota bacterium]
MTLDEAHIGNASSEPTTFHARRALEGCPMSLAWIVERFHPLLLAQARMRIGRGMRAYVEPEDLVHDVWSIALPRLDRIARRDGEHTRAFRRFLSRTLLYHLQNQVRKHITGKALPLPLHDLSSGHVDARLAGTLTELVQRESRVRVDELLHTLDPDDRRLLLLRVIEGHPVRAVAGLLHLSEAALMKRQSRLLERLRRSAPWSLLP